MNTRTIGITLALTSGVLFALYPVFFRFANAGGINTMTVLAYRFLLASLVAWPLMLRMAPRTGHVKLPPARMAGFAFMGFLYVVESTLYLLSTQYVPIAVTSIALYLYPACVTLLARVFLREKLTLRKVFALLMALAGAVLTVGAPGASVNLIGVGLGLGCCAVYSGYLIIGTKLQAGVPALTATAYIQLSAGVLALGFGLMALPLGLPMFDFQPITEARTLLSMFLMAVFATALPILSLLASIQRIGASLASILSMTELVATALFGIVLFGELLQPLQWLGGLLVILAVAMLSFGKPR
ncbi:MAG: DMT family transporter [Anaerolineae bacterium]|nr:DMT family transporter [Anaerolineae bacterium]